MMVKKRFSHRTLFQSILQWTVVTHIFLIKKKKYHPLRKLSLAINRLFSFGRKMSTVKMEIRPSLLPEKWISSINPRD